MKVEIVENTTPRKSSINREKIESENNGQVYNELFFFKLLLNEDLSKFLISLINTNLRHEREKKLDKGKDISRLNDLTDITFWKFITDYLKNIYSNKNNDKIPPELI